MLEHVDHTIEKSSRTQGLQFRLRTFLVMVLLAGPLTAWLGQVVYEKMIATENDVVLPTAKSYPLVRPPVELFVNIDHEGVQYVEGRAITLEDLTQRLAEFGQVAPIGGSVVVRVDERCQLSSIEAVTDACVDASCEFEVIYENAD